MRLETKVSKDFLWCATGCAKGPLGAEVSCIDFAFVSLALTTHSLEIQHPNVCAYLGAVLDVLDVLFTLPGGFSKKGDRNPPIWSLKGEDR